MIRDFHADPLPQGCPFSFISNLKRNAQTKVSEQATLGALQYESCESVDLSVRTIKDWFAFSLDKKTTGVWGYFNQGVNNFKVTAGGKQTTGGVTSGKDQSLVELWDGTWYHGLNIYVKLEGTKPQTGYYLYTSGFVDGYTCLVQDNDSGFWGFSQSAFEYKLVAGKTETLWQIWSSAGFYYATYVANSKAGFYQTSSGDADFFGGFTKYGEASIWGYNSTQWEFKMEAKGAATSLQMYSSGSSTVGFAKMYAYSAAGGFSCSLGDNVSSTLEPSSLWCIDKISKTNSNLYAGGLFIGQNNNSNSCFIDGSFIHLKDPGADAKIFPGWVGVSAGNSYFYADGGYVKLSYGGSSVATIEGGALTLTGGGTVYASASDLGGKTAYFQPLNVCVGGQSKTAYFLMTDPS